MDFPEYAVTPASDDHSLETAVYLIHLVDDIPTVEFVAGFEDRETAIEFCDVWRGRARPTE